MKLVEALKNLKTIEKRLLKNNEQISEYCAYVKAETETPHFETQEKQTAEVKSLVQANHDLITEYLRLKRAIEFTNLHVKVTIGERTHTISELLTIRGTKTRKGLYHYAIGTYNALNSVRATQRLQQVFNRGGVDVSNPPKVVTTWDEAEKNTKQRDWEDFFSAIDGKLEVVNAETELQHY